MINLWTAAVSLVESSSAQLRSGKGLQRSKSAQLNKVYIY